MDKTENAVDQLKDEPDDTDTNVYRPWTVKKVDISLGGLLDDCLGFLSALVISDVPENESGHNQFSLYFDAPDGDEDNWALEQMDLAVARKLRDFLIYAVPD